MIRSTVNKLAALEFFGVSPGASTDNIEAAIARKRSELRRDIASGRLDAITASAAFSRYAAALRQPASTTTGPPTKPTVAQQKTAVEAPAILAMLAIGLPAALYLAFSITPTPVNTNLRDQLSCESAVRSLLLSPTSARFAEQHHQGRRITGTVDSQNGFGVLIRSHFTCEIGPQGDASAHIF